MITALFLTVIFLGFIYYLNTTSRNYFFFQPETKIRKQLDFILQIWDNFDFNEVDKIKLRMAFEYFINHPSEYNGTSIINDFWLIKGLEPESVIHDYDYIMAIKLSDLLKANKQYCQRLRKRNSNWLWVWGFIYCGLTIVSIFKSVKYIKLKK